MGSQTLCNLLRKSGSNGQTERMICVQTNNIPNHCPCNTLFKPQNFDYEVCFNKQELTTIDFKNEETEK